MLIYLLAILIFLCIVYFFLRARSQSYSVKTPFADLQFVNPFHPSQSLPTPSILSPPTCYISLVVPAYNEEDRITGMLDETLAYLHSRQEKNPSFTYEIIICDDGSKDNTSGVVIDYIKDRYAVEKENIKLLRMSPNRGKGHALKQSVLRSSGQYILMVDADAATDINDLERLEAALQKSQVNGTGVAVGSRAHLTDNAVAHRAWYRNILMHGFHFLVWSLSRVRGIKDTQCGFKLFTRETAKVCFANIHIDRWCFDVELLSIAQDLKMPVLEVPVNWREIAGSKLNIISDSITMARDLFIIRVFYMLGFWTVESNVERLIN